MLLVSKYYNYSGFGRTWDVTLKPACSGALRSALPHFRNTLIMESSEERLIEILRRPEVVFFYSVF